MRGSLKLGIQHNRVSEILHDMATTLTHTCLFLMTLVICMPKTAHSNNPNPAEFVKSSCRATRYPVLCVQSLLAYASVIRRSDRQLALTALSVSISGTRSSASFVNNMSKVRGMKPREWRAVQDCVEIMGDSVDRLRDSVRELGRTGRAVGDDFVWHISNVQTWVSAALTDDNTCLDGFSASPINPNVKLKAAIKDRVLHVAQLTSNALALVNRFASNHRPPIP